MDRATLADERGAVAFEHSTDPQQNTPAAVHIRWIVVSVHLIRFKADAVVDFDWLRVDLYPDTQRLQDAHELDVEIGH